MSVVVSMEATMIDTKSAQKKGKGTKESPWVLKTPPGSSEFEAYRDIGIHRRATMEARRSCVGVVSVLVAVIPAFLCQRAVAEEIRRRREHHPRARTQDDVMF
jgi:hypothetical protein